MTSTLVCKSLLSFASKAYIISTNENIDPLVSCLSLEGFSCFEVRGPYAESETKYSASMKCLVNHANAWRRIISSEEPGLVVEADFVPVMKFSSLPVPAPFGLEDASLSYLYACGPQFWDLAINGVSARGHAGATVAYLVSPRVADLMLQFYKEVIAENPAGKYRAWDTEIGYWLKSRQIQSYIPLKSYGEHGGKWNPEHRQAGMRRPHRADVLVNPLAFLPFYATSSWKFYFTRIASFVYGLGRLFCGRLVAWHDIKRGGGRSLLAAGISRFNPLSQFISSLGSRRLYSCIRKSM